MKNLMMVVAMAMFLIGCDDKAGSTDDKQKAATEKMVSEANKQVGMPHITNFTERKLAKSLLDLRDTEGLQTWTYIVDLHGKLHLLCESIGYGLPYSVQFTNPEREIRGYQSIATLPQPDPNGLFMPGGLSATWVMMATPKGPKPLYVEPQIIVSPVKLHKT